MRVQSEVCSSEKDEGNSQDCYWKHRKRHMKIGNREIGNGKVPYIVAEISGNHCGSLDNAKRLIRAAKRAGADAVKTQCYEPGTITLDCNKLDFIVQDGLWKGRTMWDLYSKAHTPFSCHK